jgi:hypothetical protein
MIPHLVYYHLAIVGGLWLCIMLHYVWPSQNAVSPQPLAKTLLPRSTRKRPSESKPFTGLTQRSPCATCEQEARYPTPSSPRRPDPMPATNRRPRVIDTSMHFCPHEGCDY